MIPSAPPQPLTVRTPAGRVFGYYDFGDPEGTPVLAMHGTPACGAGFVWADTVCRERGVRLLAPDRPGIGYSDRLPAGPQATVVDHTAALLTFADALDVDSFSLLGYSGGGPYALAMAHAVPDRTRALAVVSGAGHVGEWATLADFDTTDRQMSRLATRVPSFARIALATSARIAKIAPRVSMWFAMTEMAAADREIVAQFPSASSALAVFTQAFLRGGAGVVDDYAALARPWGFQVEDITVPVHCWHATSDVNVPHRHTEDLAARIPGAGVTMWDGEGHLAIVGRVDEVLDCLLALPAQ